MNEWIDGKADPPPPEAKLPVLPLPPATRAGQVRRAAAPAPSSAPSPIPQVTAPSPVTARPPNGAPVQLAKPVSSTAPAKTVAVVPSSPATPTQSVLPGIAAAQPTAAYDTAVFDPLAGFGSNEIAFPFHQFDVTDKRNSIPESKKNVLGGLNSDTFFRGVPSWLASFVFHLTLILVLALMTIAAEKGSKIEFVMSDQPRAQDLDFMEVAVEFDSVTKDDDKEKLLTDAEDIQSDLQRLDVNLDHFDNQLADQFEATDSLLPSRVEFDRGDGKGASFFGTGALGSKFVFVVDCSGSMGDEYRWVMARRELKEAILGLTDEQQFFVFLYNDTSFAYTGKPAKLIPATMKNKGKIFKWLDKQFPIGDTRPWKAMRLSLRMKPDAIFLLSDGELKDDTVPRLRRENRKKTSSGEKIGKIPIHTVSLGTGVGSLTMREIANENDGTFTLVNTW